MKSHNDITLAPLSDDFFIDADIQQAQTPPGWFYGSDAMFRLQREHIFAQTWHVALRAAELPATTGVVPVTLLEGALNEPLLFTRDASATLRCLSNVCTHRGNVMVKQASCAPSIRCPYHGRRFGLDGRVISAPGFDTAQDFPRASDALPDVQTSQFGPLVFASLSPRTSFEQLIEPVRRRVGALFDWDALVFDASSLQHYDVQANWALYCDNYLEGLHIPYVHRGLARAIDVRSYKVELAGQTVLQTALANEGELHFNLPTGHCDAGAKIAAYYFWLFPTTMLNVYPWGVSVNVVTPLAPQQTRVSFMSFVADAAKREQGAGSQLHDVELEDEAVVDTTQRGVQSRLYHRGRYAPEAEAGVHHFHRLLTAMLWGDREPI